jgi:hypothetical protein
MTDKAFQSCFVTNWILLECFYLDWILLEYIYQESIYLESKLDSSIIYLTRLDLSRKQTGFICKMNVTATHACVAATFIF